METEEATKKPASEGELSAKVDVKEADVLEETKTSENVDPAHNSEDSDLNNVQKKNDIANDKDQSPPPPDTAPVLVAPLTVDDTIKLGNSKVPRPDDNVSLIVHVDDTQNDLDADILGSASVKSSQAASPELATDGSKETTNGSDSTEGKTSQEKSTKKAESSAEIKKVSNEAKKKETANKADTVDKAKRFVIYWRA